MDRHKSAMKRNRQNTVQRMRNRSKRTHVRHQLREILQSIDTKDVEKAAEQYRSFTSVIDKAVNQGLVHKNAAARHKSRLSRKLNESPAVQE